MESASPSIPVVDEEDSCRNLSDIFTDLGCEQPTGASSVRHALCPVLSTRGRKARRR
jgi:hypothetical protein